MEFHNKQLLDYALFAFERKELYLIKLNTLNEEDYLYNIDLFFSDKSKSIFVYENEQACLNDFNLLKQQLTSRCSDLITYESENQFYIKHHDTART